jgi:hypothetical protein
MLFIRARRPPNALPPPVKQVEAPAEMVAPRVTVMTVVRHAIAGIVAMEAIAANHPRPRASRSNLNASSLLSAPADRGIGPRTRQQVTR